MKHDRAANPEETDALAEVVVRRWDSYRPDPPMSQGELAEGIVADSQLSALLLRRPQGRPALKKLVLLAKRLGIKDPVGAASELLKLREQIPLPFENGQLPSIAAGVGPESFVLKNHCETIVVTRRNLLTPEELKLFPFGPQHLNTRIYAPVEILPEKLLHSLVTDSHKQVVLSPLSAPSDGTVATARRASRDSENMERRRARAQFFYLAQSRARDLARELPENSGYRLLALDEWSFHMWPKFAIIGPLGSLGRDQHLSWFASIVLEHGFEVALKDLSKHLCAKTVLTSAHASSKADLETLLGMLGLGAGGADGSVGSGANRHAVRTIRTVPVVRFALNHMAHEDLRNDRLLVGGPLHYWAARSGWNSCPIRVIVSSDDLEGRLMGSVSEEHRTHFEAAFRKDAAWSQKLLQRQKERGIKQPGLRFPTWEPDPELLLCKLRDDFTPQEREFSARYLRYLSVESRAIWKRAMDTKRKEKKRTEVGQFTDIIMEGYDKWGGVDMPIDNLIDEFVEVCMDLRVNKHARRSFVPLETFAMAPANNHDSFATIN